MHSRFFTIPKDINKWRNSVRVTYRLKWLQYREHSIHESTSSEFIKPLNCTYKIKQGFGEHAFQMAAGKQKHGKTGICHKFSSIWMTV